MKKIIPLMGLLLITSLIHSQTYRKIEMQAAGLTCSMCSNAINKALKTVDFIDSIKTDLKNNLFIIAIKQGTTPDPDIIRKKVEGAGFSVARLTMEMDLSGVQVNNDKSVAVGGKAFHFLNIKDQVLQGWQKVQLVEKGFLTATQAKKWSKATAMECYKTGVAGACCKNPEIKEGQRIYHVTLNAAP